MPDFADVDWRKMSQQERDLGPKEYALMQQLAGEMEHVWLAETTTMADRKTLLRYLIKRVHLDGVREQGKIHLDVEWHTGAHTALTIDRALVGAWAPRRISAGGLPSLTAPIRVLFSGLRLCLSTRLSALCYHVT